MSGLYLTVSKANDQYNVSVDCNHDYILSNHVYAYGTQPPLIQEPVTLELVTDKSEPNRGPAWFKTLSHTKTVILPERALSPLDDAESAEAGEKKVRHVTIDPGMTNFKRKGVAQSGDKAWVCNWPDTYLELFIYAQQNSSSLNWALASSSESLTQTSSPSSTTSTPSTSMIAESALDALPTESSSSEESDTAHLTKSKDYGKPYEHERFPGDPSKSSTEPSTESSTESSTTSTSTSTTTSTTTSSTTTEPAGPFPTEFGSLHMRQLYPRVIKLEERRVSTSGAPMPQCTQVEIRGPDQKAEVMCDGNGEPIVVKIVEMEPFGGSAGMPTTDVVDDFERRSLSSSGDQKRRGLQSRDGSDMSSCGCMWFST